MLVIQTDESGLPVVRELIGGKPVEVDRERWSEVLDDAKIDRKASIPVAVELRNIVVELVRSMAGVPL